MPVWRDGSLQWIEACELDVEEPSQSQGKLVDT
jgi:hypothetical protein